MIQYEQKIKGHGKPITTTKLKQIIKKGQDCTCKIISQKGVASGFFCKIEKDIFLFTNNHVINQNFINNNKKLVIIYQDQEKVLNLNNRKKNTNINLDFTIIEIKDTDNVTDYFEIDYYIDSNKNEYLKKDIGILQYPNGNELSFSEGEIININNFILFHSVSTDYGSSGSPIFLIDNLKIIGIHSKRVGNVNSGIFMKNILDNLNDIKNISPCEEKIPFSGIENHDGEEAVMLQIKCPIDDCTNMNDILFKHDNCGAILYINENGKVFCQNCGIKQDFHSFKFNCNLHSNYLFPSKDVQRLIASFAILGRLKGGGGKKFIKKLMDSLIDNCDDSDF